MTNLIRTLEQAEAELSIIRDVLPTAQRLARAMGATFTVRPEVIAALRARVGNDG